jgi:hypothetical protein
VEPTVFTDARQSAAPLGKQVLRPLAQPDRPGLRLEREGSPGRILLERRVADRFARQHQARIEHFLPLLLSLDLAGQSGAIAGLRCAGRARLFLEYYLECGVEQAISRIFREPVGRDQILEIGNLVSLVPGAAPMLFAILPSLLDDAGVRWVACTATPQVRSMLQKLGFSTRTLATADPKYLGAGAAAWGTYYESRPTVIAGDVRLAVQQASRQPGARRLRRLLREELAGLADVIRAERG